jgi:formylglycine-generating enzyme required for sulfatase activity
MEIAAAGVAFELIPIPAGEFLMGSENRFFAEGPVHRVTLTREFLLGKYPVTQLQWQAVMGNNPSTFRDSPNHPVDSVSWDLAVEFCHRLSGLTRCRVRLPSEAEWEYACRAGSKTEFFFGSWPPFVDDHAIPWEVRQGLCEYAWFDLNSDDRTHPVGSLRPNPWGLHDLLGNVWEWCADAWHGSYVGAPSDGGPWMENDERQPRRCLRGGAWDMNAFRCRSCYRSDDHRALATSRFGFRVAMDG